MIIPSPAATIDRHFAAFNARTGRARRQDAAGMARTIAARRIVAHRVAHGVA
jgi:hypothetical protein